MRSRMGGIQQHGRLRGAMQRAPARHLVRGVGKLQRAGLCVILQQVMERQPQPRHQLVQPFGELVRLFLRLHMEDAAERPLPETAGKRQLKRFGDPSNYLAPARNGVGAAPR